jgi:pyruvate dehydrogenase E2 component (dihydrolipoamide acetyltransferase)
MNVALEFLLPDVGEGLAEATIVRWLVPVGGEVGMDEPMVEVETDKAVMEMPAPRAGVVLHHGAAQGEVLEVGSLLVVIGDRGEEWSPGSTTEAEAVPASPKPAAPVVGTLEEAESPEGVRALPMIRRLAADLGVDLAGVAGSGPGGRIVREDVELAAAASGPVDRVRLSATRLAIGRHLSRSWQEIPHVTTFAEADADSLLAERAARAADGDPLPLEALLIARVTPLLVEFGEFNATLQGEHLLLRRHYDVGFAVDTPEGLMVAVVRGADRRDVPEIAAEVVRLAEAARERTITTEELRGATFTISNIGAVGGGYGTPIIPLGTTSILSVGRADPRPVVSDGSVVVGRRFPLSLSYDHRVIDGALGRRFTAAVVSALERE